MGGGWFLKPVRDAETGLFYLRSNGTAGCGLERCASGTQRSTFSVRLTDWSVWNRGGQTTLSFEKVT
jgi:hypothetical protein